MLLTREIETAKPLTIEWPTVALIAAMYSLLALVMWFFHTLPWWGVAPIAAYLVALHGSLQHEVLHGHPTRNRLVNELLVSVNPSLWFPYRRYRKLHLTHHNDAHLTDPLLDPESYYLLPDRWARLPAPMKQLYTLNNTLAGRMILGPIIAAIRFWSCDLMAIVKGDRDALSAWLLHIPACAVTLFYALWVCGIPFWQYVLLFAYPGVALMLVRSFCEHQAAEDEGERTIIVEASPFWALLFLNNNLHVAHHTRPRLAWYELPAYYRAERDALVAKNNGYRMNGYGEIFRRYFLRPKEPVAHPLIK
ncbi:fatty acid desaturase [Nordella sp. HKS 07]|uniref:fatty acid desaturase n=1 Tax=Nordella sp. HKS 07 TaxID=2712222 RepID=UPI0013E17EEE|nr:fatty acid desaturase [Nordella sp. HKS 07]QIG50072.1 fatty acid desaturase [Nordella sp. HKS 07]